MTTTTRSRDLSQLRKENLLVMIFGIGAGNSGGFETAQPLSWHLQKVHKAKAGSAPKISNPENSPFEVLEYNPEMDYLVVNRIKSTNAPHT